jgi:protein ImuB
MYACLYRPTAPDAGLTIALDAIAREFSPRYERHGDDVVTIDVDGLERLLGPPAAIADELRRDATDRGMRVHVAIAGTCTAALILAHARPGVTVINRGEEPVALAGIAIGILERVEGLRCVESLRCSVLDTRAGNGPRASARGGGAPRAVKNNDTAAILTTFKTWGLKTLGELAALPPADLTARLGRPALVWQAIARGEDIRPLVPTLDAERFEASMDLDWPIEELEPLSFVLTRLLEPLSTRLERRDRGAAVLHALLRLVTRDATGSGRELYARHLELPSPMRDVRTLRTLALLDLESHPPAAAIDRVSIVIDPTPGRVLQHTLFTRAHPTPEQLSTLLARLAAVMGQDRVGAPATVDTYRPGAFTMTAFKTDHRPRAGDSGSAAGLQSQSPRLRSLDPRASFGEARQSAEGATAAAPSPQSPLTSALRRCRQPVPARVLVADGRPVRVTTDRRGFVGGAVIRSVGPWRTSGDWWATDTARAGRAGGAGRAGEAGEGHEGLRRSVLDTPERYGARASARGGGAPREVRNVGPRAFNKDEWDISLSDGAVYRVFQDRDTDAWFIDAIVD